MRAAPEDRQRIWRSQLLNVKLFRDIYRRLQQQPELVSADDLKEMIILALPYEDYETVFETVVRWARFGNLFAYDEDTGKISLE